MKRDESVTIKDVARRAGVAQATAARALGSYGRINAATRERVLAAAEELGYRTNALARSMVTRTTQTLGLVVADIENLFFARIARAVTDVARQRGYAVLLLNTDEDLDRERDAVRVLAEQRVAGLIVVPASSTDGAHLRALMTHHIPVVLLDRSVENIDTDTVMVDNAAAAYGAVQHLTVLGHRHISMITASATIATTALRLAGFTQALVDAGVSDPAGWARVGEYTHASAFEETVALLSLPADRRPTAIFTTDSILAAGAFRGIVESGLKIPDDVSLIGFDDMDWMSLVWPPITVVDQPVRELGTRAARRLMARIEGDEGPVQHVSLATALLLRDSCAPPGGASSVGRRRTTPRRHHATARADGAVPASPVEP